MGGLLTQQCSARGDRDGGGYARGRRRSRGHSVSVRQEGFHVMGPCSGGSLGASFVLTD